MDSMQSILLTGATGQLGSFLLAELLGCGRNPAFEGEIIALKRSTSSNEQLQITARFFQKPGSWLESHPQIQWITADLSDGIALADQLSSHLEGEITVIHAAAVIDINQGTSGNNPNVHLAQEALLMAEAIEAKHFTQVSSIAVMGNSAPLEEVTELGPNNFQPNKNKEALGTYAKSKIQSELEVWRAHEEGLSVSIIRPGVILGVGPIDQAPQELWKRIWTNKLPVSTDGRSGVVDVRDVAGIVVQAHLGRILGPIIAVGSNPEFDTLLRGMASGLGLKRSFYKLNRNPWLNRMRRLDFLKSFPFIGRFFSASTRIMLFSRNTYDGSTGIALIDEYTPLDHTLISMGSMMKEVANGQ
jgi:nucleoside-diphosphate-sugar epimerase